MARLSLALLVLCLAAAPMWAQAPDTAIVVAFESAAITASGLTHGGEVLLFGVANSRNLQWEGRTLGHYSLLLKDERGDGSVRASLPQALPVDSVWAVVDLGSGRMTVARPARSSFRQVPFAAGLTSRGGSGTLDQLETGREQIDLLLVRPHAGAWTYSGGDGAAGDADAHADGRLTVDVARMKPAATGAPAPSRYTPHDLLVLFDARRMEFATTEVAP